MSSTRFYAEQAAMNAGQYRYDNAYDSSQDDDEGWTACDAPGCEDGDVLDPATEDARTCERCEGKGGWAGDWLCTRREYQRWTEMMEEQHGD